MALTNHVFAHTSGEESLARFVKPDACALLNQHADFTQFVFVQTHLAALAFAIIFSSIHRVCTASDCRLAKGAHWHWVPVGFLCCLAGLLGRSAKLRERFVELIRKFDELADGGDRAARSLRRLARDVGNDL